RRARSRTSPAGRSSRSSSRRRSRAACTWRSRSRPSRRPSPSSPRRCAAVVASALRGARLPPPAQPVTEELAEGAAETALLADEQVMLEADEQVTDDGGLGSACGGDLKQ